MKNLFDILDVDKLSLEQHFFEKNNNYSNGEYNIDEMLFSHSTNDLIKKLNELGINNIRKVNNDEICSFFAEINNTDLEKVEKLLFYYNFYISQNTNGILYIEPRYTENVTKYIEDNCHCTVYHITHKDNLKNILKHGLECKSKGYRKYDKRIFLYASENDIKSVLKDSPKYNSNSVILKITFTRGNIDIYKDNAMLIDNSYYTYDNIPPQWIEIIKL